MSRRTILLLLSFLLAASGTGLLFAYVSHVDDRALKDQNPREVLVVKKLVAQGLSVADAQNAGDFELKKVAGSAIAPGALNDLTAIKSLVTLAPLYPGEQLLSQKFGLPGSSSVLALPPGKIAVSAQFTDPARVAGFVQPGSDVAVFASGKLDNSKAKSITAVLLPRATVIAVGPSTLSTSSTNGESLPRAIITLALTQEQALKLIFADQNGSLYLGLLDAKSVTSTVGGVTEFNVLS